MTSDLYGLLTVYLCINNSGSSLLSTYCVAVTLMCSMSASRQCIVQYLVNCAATKTLQAEIKT